jgi:hypothetical protein
VPHSSNRSTPTLLTVALSIVLLTGCGGGGDATTGPATIHGPDIFVHDVGVTEMGPLFQAVTAYYFDDDGAEVSLAVEPLAGGGGLSIPDAPDGDYYIQIDRIDRDPLLLVTSSRELDIGTVYHGRYDAHFGPMSTPVIAVDVAGLEPWQANDQMHLYSAGANGYEPNLHQGALLGVQPNDTQADGVFSVESMARPNSLDGDRVWLNQLATRSLDGGATYQALSRSFMSAGDAFGVYDLFGSMTEVPQTESVSIDWRAAEFAAQREQVHANAEPGFALLYVSVRPGDPAWGSYGASADLVHAYSDIVGAVDRETTYAYGDPFPVEWTRFAAAQTFFRTGFSVGASDSADIWAGTWHNVPLDDSMQIRPAINPPVDVTVDGEAAVDGGTISAQPLIEWSAPTRGDADLYMVRLGGLTDVGAGQRPWVGQTLTAFTRDTSMRIPARFMGESDGYVVIVTAIAAPNVDANRPFVNPWPYSGADTIVGTLVPAE